MQRHKESNGSMQIIDVELARSVLVSIAAQSGAINTTPVLRTQHTGKNGHPFTPLLWIRYERFMA